MRWRTPLNEWNVSGAAIASLTDVLSHAGRLCTYSMMCVESMAGKKGWRANASVPT
jgi:hypothetical protein